MEKTVLHKKKKVNKKKIYILINNQRWKIATHVRHKASWTLRSLIPPSAIFPHDRQPNKRVTLHFYQKMVQSSLTRDGQWRDVMETSCVSYYNRYDGNGEVNGVLLGLIQKCVQFKVLSYRDCWSAVSVCVSGVENICYVISLPTW